MWHLRRLTTLEASNACYSDNFTSYLHNYAVIIATVLLVGFALAGDREIFGENVIS
jgi:hypothetical protein